MMKCLLFVRILHEGGKKAGKVGIASVSILSGLHFKCILSLKQKQ